MTRAVCVAH